MKKVYPNIMDFDDWEKVYKSCLTYANHFNIVYPIGKCDEENPLMTGKDEFLSLSGTIQKPWDGMQDSVVISGGLNSTAIFLFNKYIEPSFNGESSYLWQWQLLKEDVPCIEVSDFNVCTITLSEDLLALFAQTNICLTK
ncbi:hypothetical protein [Pseudalkalibacillus berkeleyi]|uniref:Uncharacterized protein n=1 Tax=Pseudalkalibacillus berkeleyi TaxID=1069813 RepID=A0ABS9H582_9BACL|nr:hypothetical protein [Pseudalkalibacillus berkeleyi]MCF6138850.1 hypothetical protein [Pseudalkalibacillus berkeleyi]